MADWTPQQQQAIDEKPNLLVNAAAGSGKTAVLVERITKKLIPDSEGKYINADELLVVTFARDAAHEMQERIKKSLNSLFASCDDAAFKNILKRQIKKLPFTDIATIDSFCMTLVKNNFHLLGIDPKFGIMDASETKIYTIECIDEYFKKLYDEQNEGFLKLTEIYSSGYNDRELTETVYEIYTFTRALADPEKWIREHTEDYKRYTGSAVFEKLKQIFTAQASASLKKVMSVKKGYASEAGSSDADFLRSYGKKDLWTAFENDISLLKTLQKDGCAGDLYFDEINKTGYGSSKSEETEIQKKYIDLRNSAIADIRKLMSDYRNDPEETDNYYAENLYPHARALCDVLCGFSDYFYAKKVKASKFEFNDLEHMAIKLLTEFEDIRENLKNKYTEILMDEYQDTNDLQERIFSLISKGDNRFIVGDLKQSIYRFRQSDPTIFLEKDILYRDNPESGRRIVLSKNFRSRKGVLDSINYLFSDIMTKETGEIDYDEEQALHYGNHFFDSEAKENSYASELYLIESACMSDEEGDEELFSDTELEAEFVAKKIREMIDGKYQILKKDGTFRDAEPEDFAILMNAVKSTGEIYVNALSKYGLNSYSEDSGFFEKTEIRMVLEFVRVVNNPFDDIPLLSVMRSPVYRFTDEELGQIRLCGNGEMWLAVKEASCGADSFSDKCRDFVGDIEKWREMSLYMTADRLIWRIITDTSLYDMCGILYGGEAALANLRLLVERAGALSRDGIATLFDFEQYAVRLLNSDGMGCAKISGGGVTIMTIHKSKGLEFPIVFVSGTGRRFVNDSYGSSIYMHKKYGFGINGVDVKKSVAAPSINKRFIDSVKKSEAGAEQLRKLYVALTRAKEKLIVTGVVRGTSTSGAFDFTDSEVDNKYIKGCNSYIAMTAPTVKKCTDKSLWEYHEIPYTSKQEAGSEVKESIKEKLDVADNIKNEVFTLLDKFDSLQKPESVQSKISVSAIKNNVGFAAKLKRVPEFMKSSSITGASFGTAVHEVMEKIAYTENMSREYIKSQFPELADNVAEKIYLFFSCSLGRRCVENNAVREASFETQIPLNNELTLLQGIIDCYFEENGKIVLIDYKTDSCSDIHELEEKYSEQLRWYKYAIEKILGKQVIETYIYSFHKNEPLKIEWSEYDEI